MDVLNQNLSLDWQRSIREHVGNSAEIQRISVVGGGSINDARRIETTKGTFFAKMNNAKEFPGMFEAEAKGLDFLLEHSEFRIPKSISTGETEEVQWVLMENINSTNRRHTFWEDFGRKLAKMHLETNDTFGLQYNNYLGSLHQINSPIDNWHEFFAEMRIKPQLDLATENGQAKFEMLRLFDKLLGRIEKYFPKEPPSAIHGDLWTGNFMTDSEGDAVIFDPAVYYGHREMDIGMSKLFGGFDKRFYDAYNEVFPLEEGWEERIHIANLYPLMAHVNLFGGSYTSQVINILRKHI